MWRTPCTSKVHVRLALRSHEKIDIDFLVAVPWVGAMRLYEYDSRQTKLCIFGLFGIFGGRQL